MPDQQINPEPIEEKDVNLKEKFPEGSEAKQPEELKISEQKTEKPALEQLPKMEQESTLERKEGIAEKEDAYAKILSKVADGKTAKDEDISADAEMAMRQKDAEAKVNNLVTLAETKGLAHAVKVARHMENNYVLDEFHDKLLSDELHEFLAKKGLIKEI
ncbi:MAG TPA: hypothetical protein P5262_02280 [Candidatus Moranbacteria bacterium]|nr:hypothetical protein [Candidatus Moranbacteria bacterium]